MRLLLRSLLLLGVFAAVALLTARAVVAHAVGRGTPLPEVHLAAAMAGLFAGGAAMLLVLIVLLTLRR